ncbi:uncharacterized protein [Equus caballus]|uniref:uncharacterized protein isoform X1 n=1 Tax=Equus caballus TaxID=9796 RepID=UPI0038B23F53
MVWPPYPGCKEPYLDQTPREARALAGGSHPYISDIGGARTPERCLLRTRGQAAGALETERLPELLDRRQRFPHSVTFPEDSGEQGGEIGPSSGSHPQTANNQGHFPPPQPDCAPPGQGLVPSPLGTSKTHWGR